MIFRWRAQPNQLLRLALSSFQNQGISNRYYCQVECYRKPLLQSSYTNNANTTPISTNYLPTPAARDSPGPGHLALAMGSVGHNNNHWIRCYRCYLISSIAIKYSMQAVVQCVHGIIGRRFPDEGLLRYRK